MAKETVHEAGEVARKGGDAGGGLGMPDSGNLSHAVGVLHSQHPIKWNDLGPHHHKDHHLRHMPLHGLKPRG